jgi:hypothetical protein
MYNVLSSRKQNLQYLNAKQSTNLPVTAIFLEVTSTTSYGAMLQIKTSTNAAPPGQDITMTDSDN